MIKKNIIQPDLLSLTTQQIATFFSETNVVLSTATSFIYERSGRLYLVTNWHNVTGKNPLTDSSVSDSNAGIPDMFLTYFRLVEGNGQSEPQKIKLYEDDELMNPKWLIHPIHKEKVDVVVIEITNSEKYILHPINQILFEEDMAPLVGDDCFVIGYPFGDLRYLGLPIWKKASIATEPTVNEDQLPKLLIDTATRPGLSGSPVIWQRTGIHKLGEGGEINNDSFIGRARGFLGIYSGRIGKDEIHAQLGIVWKKKVIDEIIDGNTKGNIDFQIK